MGDTSYRTRCATTREPAAVGFWYGSQHRVPWTLDRGEHPVTHVSGTKCHLCLGTLTNPRWLPTDSPCLLGSNFSPRFVHDAKFLPTAQSGFIDVLDGHLVDRCIGSVESVRVLDRVSHFVGQSLPHRPAIASTVPDWRISIRRCGESPAPLGGRRKRVCTKR